MTTTKIGQKRPARDVQAGWQIFLKDKQEWKTVSDCHVVPHFWDHEPIVEFLFTDDSMAGGPAASRVMCRTPEEAAAADQLDKPAGEPS